MLSPNQFRVVSRGAYGKQYSEVIAHALAATIFDLMDCNLDELYRKLIRHADDEFLTVQEE